MLELWVEKTNQHYVWRAYLKPWSINGLIPSYRKGVVRHRSLRKVASAELFYSIPEISAKDAAYIELLAIDKSPEGMKKIHRRYVAQCRKPWIVKRYLERVGLEGFKKIDLQPLGFEGDELNHEKLYYDAVREADEAIANDEEDYLGRVETGFLPLLKLLLIGDTSFYAEPKHAGEFVSFISVQYLRTKKIREEMEQTFKTSLKDFGRLWTVFAHIFANNVGRSFFGGFRDYKIVVVENVTPVRFITGDQPVINLHGNPFTRAVPEDMELYYPLSPTKALFYVKATNDNHPPVMTDPVEVERYNILIAQYAHEQIFADTEEAVEKYKQYVEPAE
jgi:hypothetical protein